MELHCWFDIKRCVCVCVCSAIFLIIPLDVCAVISYLSSDFFTCQNLLNETIFHIFSDRETQYAEPKYALENLHMASRSES